MIQEIKNLRVQIDGLAQLVKELKPIEKGRKYQRVSLPINLKKINSNEINKAYDSLILAKAWLGKVLQELGEPTPYTKDGQRKTVEDIEPTADQATIVHGLREPFTGKNSREPQKSVDTWELNGRPMNDYDSMSHIERVDWLREEIKKLIDNTTDFSQEHPEVELEQSFVYKYLSEARFWLGFELQRIRENDNRN